MAGIYIHIPFCRKACFYCDFHFSVSFKYRDDIINGLSEELKSRRHFLEKGEIVNTIYLGGGTPSVLTDTELRSLLNTVYQNYAVSSLAEITMECNPDDLTKDYLFMLKSAGVNRLSIGVQSYNEEHLKWMNRSHNAKQSIACIELAAEVGFKDITIDLIYGIPGLGEQEWRDTVRRSILHLPVNHISAYSLTMEDNTPYKKLVTQQKYERPDDDEASVHYSILIEEIDKAKWEHYEVSNFCKEKNYSKHNTAYWQGVKYLGIGPSAHSFDGVNRGWNVASNKAYIDGIQQNTPIYTLEELTSTDRLNEALLTGLRTRWGVDLAEIKKHWKYDIQAVYADTLAEWEGRDWIVREADTLRLTDGGLLMADYIASELFILGD